MPRLGVGLYCRREAVMTCLHRRMVRLHILGALRFYFLRYTNNLTYILTYLLTYSQSRVSRCSIAALPQLHCHPTPYNISFSCSCCLNEFLSGNWRMKKIFELDCSIAPCRWGWPPWREKMIIVMGTHKLRTICTRFCHVGPIGDIPANWHVTFRFLKQGLNQVYKEN